MLVNSQNWEDAKKYFHQTFIKCTETGDELFYVEEVNSQWMILSTTNGEKAGIELSRPYEISYVIPKKTVFQNGGCAAQLSRIPARMWKKGMNKQNTAFMLLDEVSNWVSTELSMGLIEGFIKKPGYMTFNEAEREFAKGTIKSAALTPRMAITAAGNVFIDSVLVAKYQRDKKTLTCKKIFSPELTAVFPKTLFREI